MASQVQRRLCCVALLVLAVGRVGGLAPPQDGNVEPPVPVEPLATYETPISRAMRENQDAANYWTLTKSANELKTKANDEAQVRLTEAQTRQAEAEAAVKKQAKVEIQETNALRRSAAGLPPVAVEPITPLSSAGLRAQYASSVGVSEISQYASSNGLAKEEREVGEGAQKGDEVIKDGDELDPLGTMLGAGNSAANNSTGNNSSSNASSNASMMAMLNDNNTVWPAIMTGANYTLAAATDQAVENDNATSLQTNNLVSQITQTEEMENATQAEQESATEQTDAENEAVAKSAANERTQKEEEEEQERKDKAEVAAELKVKADATANEQRSKHLDRENEVLEAEQQKLVELNTTVNQESSDNAIRLTELQEYVARAERVTAEANAATAKSTDASEYARVEQNLTNSTIAQAAEDRKEVSVKIKAMEKVKVILDTRERDVTEWKRATMHTYNDRVDELNERNETLNQKKARVARMVTAQQKQLEDLAHFKRHEAHLKELTAKMDHGLSDEHKSKREVAIKTEHAAKQKVVDAARRFDAFMARDDARLKKSESLKLRKPQSKTNPLNSNEGSDHLYDIIKGPLLHPNGKQIPHPDGEVNDADRVIDDETSHNAATVNMTSPEPYEDIWEASGPCTTYFGKCVQSPNYPSNYGKNQGCVIQVKKNITLHVVRFATENYYDKLTVCPGGDCEKGWAFSGYTGPDGEDFGPGDKMIFTSDFSVTDSGWQICEGGDEPQRVSPHYKSFELGEDSESHLHAGSMGVIGIMLKKIDHAMKMQHTRAAQEVFVARSKRAQLLQAKLRQMHHLEDGHNGGNFVHDLSVGSDQVLSEEESSASR